MASSISKHVSGLTIQIDVAVIMLGTNDLKIKQLIPVKETANNLREYCKFIKSE